MGEAHERDNLQGLRQEGVRKGGMPCAWRARLLAWVWLWCLLGGATVPILVQAPCGTIARSVLCGWGRHAHHRSCERQQDAEVLGGSHAMRQTTGAKRKEGARMRCYTRLALWPSTRRRSSERPGEPARRPHASAPARRSCAMSACALLSRGEASWHLHKTVARERNAHSVLWQRWGARELKA